MSQRERQRLRVTFSTEGSIKYVGHLDLASVWERALRRAGLPVLYSQGFHPQPKIHFASALPVGVSGRAELMDVWLSPPQQPDDVARRLQPMLPRGLHVRAVFEVPLRAPALQTQVRGAVYRVWVESDATATAFRAQLEALLASAEIFLTRRRKKGVVRYNLRPLIQEVRFLGREEDGYAFFARLQSETGSTGRPDALLQALQLADAPRRIERLCLLGVTRDGREISVADGDSADVNIPAGECIANQPGH